jgi:hypothetical protein
MNPLIQLKVITLPLLVSLAQKRGMNASLFRPVVAGSTTETRRNGHAHVQVALQTGA